MLFLSSLSVPFRGTVRLTLVRLYGQYRLLDKFYLCMCSLNASMATLENCLSQRVAYYLRLELAEVVIMICRAQL